VSKGVHLTAREVVVLMVVCAGRLSTKYRRIELLI